MGTLPLAADSHQWQGALMLGAGVVASCLSFLQISVVALPKKWQEERHTDPQFMHTET